MLRVRFGWAGKGVLGFLGAFLDMRIPLVIVF
jgi:hypothetical protein